MAKVPADIDRADRIVAGLTARQLLILGADGLAVWSAYRAFGERVPLEVFAAFAAILAALGAAWALALPEGLPAERLLLAAARHLAAGPRRVLAPEGLPVRGARIRGAARTSPLRLPFRGTDGTGTIELSPAGASFLCEGSAVNLSLRSEVERRGVIASFAKMLNGLDAPVQFVVASARVDLSEVAARTRRRAQRLEHPALRRAAEAHAAFLSHLGARADVFSRQMLLCLCDPAKERDHSRARLVRRAAETQSLARGMGVKLHPLGEEAVTGLFQRSFGLEGRALRMPAGTEIVRGRP